MPLADLETITDTLLEIMESCQKDMDSCEWLDVWTELSHRLAFQFNPALQPRAIIVYGCISKQATEANIKQLLRMMVKALECHSDIHLIEAIVMCLTRLLPLLPARSPLHKFMFWIAISVLQLEDASLYAAGLALLEQNLHTLDANGLLDHAPIEKTMMDAREPLEWQFKQLDQAVGLSFKSKFHFALVGHLLKGFRHPVQNTVARTIRLLHILLGIVAKSDKQDKFHVTLTTVPYLAALVSVSEEVRCRCHLKYHTNHLASTTNLPSTNASTGSMLTHSPSNSSLFGEEATSAGQSVQGGGKQLGSLSLFTALQGQPKRQRSCDFIDSRTLILAKSKQPFQHSGQKYTLAYPTTLVTGNINNTANPQPLSPATPTQVSSSTASSPLGFLQNAPVTNAKNHAALQNVCAYYYFLS